MALKMNTDVCLMIAKRTKKTNPQVYLISKAKGRSAVGIHAKKNTQIALTCYKSVLGDDVYKFFL